MLQFTMKPKPFDWECPYCRQTARISVSDHFAVGIEIDKPNHFGLGTFYSQIVFCPNPNCRKFSLTSALYEGGKHEVSGLLDNQISKQRYFWKLLPQSVARTFPDYVPNPIIQDYNEACLIKDISPKASATLSRRCLQGMIRDFWGVKKGRLYDEIEAIKDQVDTLTWESIDSVRKIGNIGAHMEKDINLIIDVDPNEAEILIKLIEILIEDWYIKRHEKEERLKKIVQIGKSKTSG